VLLLLFLVITLLFPILCEPPSAPIHFLLIAKPGQTCSSWKHLIRKPVWVKDLGEIIDGCLQIRPTDPDPIKHANLYVKPGQGVAIIDPSRTRWDSGEGRLNGDRYFFVFAPPEPDASPVGWYHENTHLALGHSAVQYSFLVVIYDLPEPLQTFAHQIVNTFLDWVCVSPAMALGKTAAAWLRNVIASALITLLLWRMLRRLKRTASLE